jgi:large subunit ribosomal protein L25
MQLTALAATTRTQGTKGDLNLMRRQGSIPAVYYGKGKEPILLALDAKVFETAWGPGRRNTLFNLTIEGQGELPAIVYEVQKDVVEGNVIHIDFKAVEPTEKVKVTLALKLVGVPTGVKDEGGQLMQNIRKVRVAVLPEKIPAAFEYDVSDVGANQTRYVRDLPVGDTEMLTSGRVAIFTISKGRAKE